ncbi:unnamed protein product [Polarella glacialis]|uniref:Rab-GAP TBC domain-containing protein n=1 Tax=Polarella glacialis TaxID=89957 RepID=A0A813FHR9_POLGL|nr:unnamed protein product [Polarella glacialis]
METDDSTHAACAINAQSFAKSGANLPSPVRPEENSGDTESDYDQAVSAARPHLQANNGRRSEFRSDKFATSSQVGGDLNSPLSAAKEATAYFVGAPRREQDSSESQKFGSVGAQRRAEEAVEGVEGVAGVILIPTSKRNRNFDFRAKAETFKIATSPLPEHFKDWYYTFKQAASAAFPPDPDGACTWLKEAEHVDATLESLKDSGQYRQLDNRIGIILYESAIGILKRKLVQASERSDREGYKLKGRQTQLIIYSAYAIETRGQSLYQLGDLMAVKLHCSKPSDATPRDLEEFVLQRDQILDAMERQTEDVILVLFHKVVSPVLLIYRGIEDYDRMTLKDRTYDFLYIAVTRIIDSRRLRRNRERMHGSWSKARDQVCYDWLEGKCVRGIACKFSHDEKHRPVKESPGKKTNVRLNYLKGICKNGDKCKYPRDKVPRPNKRLWVLLRLLRARLQAIAALPQKQTSRKLRAVMFALALMTLVYEHSSALRERALYPKINELRAKLSDALEDLIEAYVLESSPTVMSLGKGCMDYGYNFEWYNKIATIITPTGVRIVLDIINDVPYMPEGSVKACGASLLEYVDHLAVPGPVVEISHSSIESGPTCPGNDGYPECPPGNRDIKAAPVLLDCVSQTELLKRAKLKKRAAKDMGLTVGSATATYESGQGKEDKSPKFEGHAPDWEYVSPKDQISKSPAATDVPRVVPNFPVRKGSMRPPDVGLDSWRDMGPAIRKHILDIVKMQKDIKGAEQPSICAAAPSATYQRFRPAPSMPLRTSTFEHRMSDSSPFIYSAVTKKEAEVIPKAMEALDKDWNKPHKQVCWDLNRVREWKDIASQARRTGKKVHIGRVFDICVEKNSELDIDDPNRKFKGRVVFEGRHVKDQSSNWAIFAEIASCPAAMQASKATDGYGLLPGHDVEQADGESAYTQAKLGGRRHGFAYLKTAGLMGPKPVLLKDGRVSGKVSRLKARLQLDAILGVNAASLMLRFQMHSSLGIDGCRMLLLKDPPDMFSTPTAGTRLPIVASPTGKRKNRMTSCGQWVRSPLAKVFLHLRFGKRYLIGSRPLLPDLTEGDSHPSLPDLEDAPYNGESWEDRLAFASAVPLEAGIHGRFFVPRTTAEREKLPASSVHDTTSQRKVLFIVNTASNGYARRAYIIMACGRSAQPAPKEGIRSSWTAYRIIQTVITGLQCQDQHPKRTPIYMLLRHFRNVEALTIPISVENTSIAQDDAGQLTLLNLNLSQELLWIVRMPYIGAQEPAAEPRPDECFEDFFLGDRANHAIHYGSMWRQANDYSMTNRVWICLQSRNGSMHMWVKEQHFLTVSRQREGPYQLIIAGFPSQAELLAFCLGANLSLVWIPETIPYISRRLVGAEQRLIFVLYYIPAERYTMAKIVFGSTFGVCDIEACKANFQDFEEEASCVRSLEASLEAAASAPSFWEDGEDHIRWERALAGRPVIEMPLEEVLALVRSGAAVPLKHRLVLWPLWIATGNSCTALGSANVPGSVPLSDEELESLERSVPAEVVRQINLDVSRTLPKWLGAPERAVLRRVLCSLAALQPEVGYCQGLGNIAAVFVVLGFDAAKAVAGTRALLTRCCPSYHEPGLPGFRRDAAVLAALAQKLLPVDTQRRLAALCIPLEVLATQHLIALASASDWPLCATAQLWDLLLLEGSFVKRCIQGNSASSGSKSSSVGNALFA